jgi:zinc/manganese transport system substrate-binding protein
LRKSFFILLILIILIVTACDKNTEPKINIQNSNEGSNTTTVGVGLDIMVTNKCLYTMVKDIAGENNNVEFMFKDENEEKDFKYTSDSISNIGKQDLFIYTGVGFDPWMDDFLSKVDKSKVGVINVSRGVSTTSYQNKNEQDYGSKNPYYWMDMDNYRTMLLNVKNAIEEKDPKNNSTYENNFKNAFKAVDKYKSTINNLSEKLKQYTFVTDMDKFDYIMNNVDVKTIKFYRSEQGAISPDDLQKISNDVNNNKKLCFIYDDDNDLNQNKDIINNYQMKTIKLTVYDGNTSYMDMIKQNISNIEAVLK